MIDFTLGAIIHRREDPIENIISAARDHLISDHGCSPFGTPDLGIDGRHTRTNRSLWIDDARHGATCDPSDAPHDGSTDGDSRPEGPAGRRVRLATAIEAGVDILLVGRLSDEELADHGIREAIALAIDCGVTILIAIEPDMVQRWTNVTDCSWVALPPDVTTILSWIISTMEA